jgi:hypothetical protein
MAVQGIPVVIVASKGLPVRKVTARGPLMTEASNGRGIAITYSTRGAPFVVQELP